MSLKYLILSKSYSTLHGFNLAWIQLCIAFALTTWQSIAGVWRPFWAHGNQFQVCGGHFPINSINTRCGAEISSVALKSSTRAEVVTPLTLVSFSSTSFFKQQHQHAWGKLTIVFVCLFVFVFVMVWSQLHTGPPRTPADNRGPVSWHYRFTGKKSSEM